MSAFWTPKLQDTLGRKKTLLITMGISFWCKLIMLLLPSQTPWSVNIIYIAMFIIGLQQVARTTGNYTLMMEMIPKKYQSTAGTVWCIIDVFNIVLLTIYYRFVSKDWRGSVIFALCQWLIGYSILFFILPESPKWLYDNKRYKECYKALIYMSKFNQGKEPTPEISRLIFINENFEHNQKDLSNTKEPRISPIKQILGTRHILLNTISMSLVWIGASFGYYLIAYQMKYIKGSFWINMISASIAQMLAFLLAGVLFTQVGFKPTLCISYIISIAGMVCLIEVKTES